jgi:hypothetical protein
LPGARQVVEDRALAGIGISGEGDKYRFFGHGLFSTLYYAFDFDVGGFIDAQRHMVPFQDEFDRIFEGCIFFNVDFSSTQKTHFNEPSAKGPLTPNAENRSRLAFL